jgi:hypothetical protein
MPDDAVEQVPRALLDPDMIAMDEAHKVFEDLRDEVGLGLED